MDVSHEEVKNSNDYSMMDDTSHASHTSLSLNGQQWRIPSDEYDLNKMMSSIVSSPDAQAAPAAATAKKPDKNGGSFRCIVAKSSQDRVIHIDYAHPARLYRPTPDDFENRLRILIRPTVSLLRDRDQIACSLI